MKGRGKTPHPSIIYIYIIDWFGNNPPNVGSFFCIKRKGMGLGFLGGGEGEREEHWKGRNTGTSSNLEGLSVILGGQYHACHKIATMWWAIFWSSIWSSFLYHYCNYNLILQKNFIHEFPFHPCAPIPSHVQSIPFVSSNKSKESIQLSHKFHLHCHFISMLSTSSCGEFIPSIHFLAFIRSLHLFVSSRS